MIRQLFVMVSVFAFGSTALVGADETNRSTVSSSSTQSVVAENRITTLPDKAGLIAIANEEAKKAYRIKHRLATDALAPDFDYDRKPTGAVHNNRVLPDGENWRVTLTSTLTIGGVKEVIFHVEVPLDRSGKLIGEVKIEGKHESVGR
jgi:hypothetical protein